MRFFSFLTGLGVYFEDTLFSDIESLNLYAGIHQTFFGHYRTLSKIFPFAIYYTIDSEVVNIWRVLDCRIKPAYIKEALK